MNLLRKTQKTVKRPPAELVELAVPNNHRQLTMDNTLRIGGVVIEPGTQHTLQLPIASLYTHTEMTMPVRVIRGKKDGPRLFVSAAIHGDEINGVEIIRRLLKLKNIRRLRGTLIAVPVVNVFGYTSRIRYLPDRRDLNRSFPGSPRGSMASRLAHIFVKEIVENCTHGIDLHTGAVHRSNLPQLRIRLDEEETLHLAKAFRVPVIINANLRDGSLRQSVIEHNIPMLLYESGEALRFDEQSINVGLRGILSVMRELGMLAKRPAPKNAITPIVAQGSQWVRALESGTITFEKTLGEQVSTGDLLGTLSSPLGDKDVPVVSPLSGIMIGQTMLPLVYEGEALCNIAHLDESKNVAKKLDQFQNNLDNYIEGPDLDE